MDRYDIVVNSIKEKIIEQYTYKTEESVNSLNDYYNKKYGSDKDVNRIQVEWNLHKMNDAYKNIAMFLLLKDGIFTIKHDVIEKKAIRNICKILI